MGKRDFDSGTSTVEQFFAWINERHSIYERRSAGEPKPWTSWPEMLDYKFTNVFRELDRGTLELRKMLKPTEHLRVAMTPTEVNALVIFNVIWYRMFNRAEHATDVGFVSSFHQLEDAMREKEARGERLFTSAHMTVGRAGESKLDTTLESLFHVFARSQELAEALGKCDRMEQAFELMTRKPFKFFGVGRFIRYEIITDLRWYPVWAVGEPQDTCVWANIGPGCKRGLQRLGYDVSLESLIRLWVNAPYHLDSHVASHHASLTVPHWPPFELREIEHSLCEFDKFERTRTGVGRPKERYNGRS